MKKIFILTGEPSGDKLASKVISKLQKNNPNIEYSCVGGTHLNSLGIKSIYDLKEITYIGFTSVFLNIFKIKNKINKTVEEIIKFNPDILFSVDSPDFTLRVAEKVKSINPNIKTIHYVAPQIWVWREGRIKNFKKFLDHILLLFNFEKKYFDKENIPNTFVGHPLLEQESKNKIDLSSQELVEQTVAHWQSVFPKAKVIPISALTGFFVSELLDLLTELLPLSPPYFPKDQLTDKPERFFVNESIREQILKRYNKEIPYYVEVVTEDFFEDSKIIKIRSVILVERETQKGIIIGHRGIALKQVGIGARKSLQDFFGKKIHLELFVKVSKNWRSSVKQLKRFGYNN